VNNAITVFSGTTGKLLKEVSVFIDTTTITGLSTIGTSGGGLSNLYFTSGGQLNFDGSDVVIAHSANLLTLTGGGLTVVGAIIATTLEATSTVTVGTNLLMPSGGVINFNGGDVTITHGANLLTIAGGDLTVSGLVTATTLTVTSTTTLDTALTGVLRADSGVVSTDSDVTDLVTAADLTTAGKIEIATAAETSTGTDATRAVSPDGLAGSVFGGKYAQFMLFESDTSVSTGNGVGGFAVPADYNGMDLVAATATVHTKGVTDTTDVMIRRRRGGVDADMLSVAITVGDEWFVSDGSIDTSNDDLATGDQIYCDVDAVHSGTAPLGLTVVLTFRFA
jgi:hypothetical protein